MRICMQNFNHDPHVMDHHEEWCDGRFKDMNRYFLKLQFEPESAYREVSKEEFVRAERNAGFRNTMGQPLEPATGGFSGHGVSGKVQYG